MKSIQYTIRNVPPEVDRILRARARKTGKSFNSTIVDSISRGTLQKKDTTFDKFYRASAKLTKKDHQAFDESIKWLKSLPNEIFDK
jgi:plasmid stability protein